MARKIWDFDDDLDSIFRFANILDKISTYFPYILVGIIVVAGIWTIGA